jgi:signal transduction histidine kinase
MIDTVGAHAVGHQSEDFFYVSDMVCANLLKGPDRLGCLAVRLGKDESRLFNARPVDYLKIIAAQTVTFLDKKEAGEEKKRSEKQALLGSMLSTIVHDIKNPLCGVSGFAQLIQQKCGQEDIKAYCGRILDVVERLEKMNNELLMFVRGDSVDLQKSPVALREMLEKCIASLVIDRGLETLITAAIHCENDEEMTIAADGDKLYRVFANIIANAVDAIENPGRIDVTLRRRGTTAEITIADTGKGMSAYVIQRVFEPFMTHGKKNGTGLGMAIARTIIERHGGTITAESTLGKGTVFTIHLPVSS